MTHLWQLDGSELIAGFSAGEFTPEEALQSCTQRALQCHQLINAFMHVDVEGARRAAAESTRRWRTGRPLGPLDGVPLSIKDNLHARGLPTTWGSRLLQGYLPPDDEAPVARLRAAGAVFFAKTSLPEFAMRGVTDNMLIGTTRNPWDLRLTPGGSSGGAAAALACGGGPLALVTDGGGSARRPASHCGVVGFKPSAGRVRRAGGLPEIFLDFEVPGLMARTVADIQAAWSALDSHAASNEASLECGSRALRILFVPRYGSSPVAKDVAATARETAGRMAAMGHVVDESPCAPWADEVNDAWPVLCAAGLAWMVARAQCFPEFGLAPGQALDLSRCTDAARANVQWGRDASAGVVVEAFAAVRRLQQRMTELFAAYDFILTPATACLPWPHTQSHPTHIDGQAVAPRGHAVFTAFANAAGLPAIALPTGRIGALPTGVQLVAARDGDDRLLAVARAFERAFPNPRHWPEWT